MLNSFNRLVATLLWLLLLALISYFVVAPFQALNALQGWLAYVNQQLAAWQQQDPTRFLIGQIAVGVVAVLLFGSLLWLEIWPRRHRGVRVRTREGGLVELDTESIARRLEWHLDQLADVISVVPEVKSRGSVVDIHLEVETAPNIDVPMKTDEVVEVTRHIIEHDLGLKLGKLDVMLRHAPFEEEWAA